jgi:hypothetical protein
LKQVIADVVMTRSDLKPLGSYSGIQDLVQAKVEYELPGVLESLS